MNKQNDTIEQILHSCFDEHATPEYKNTWKALKSKLAKHYFLKFNIAKLNMYYVLAILSSVVGVIAYSAQSDIAPTPKPVKQKPVIKNMHTPAVEQTLATESLNDSMPLSNTKNIATGAKPIKKTTATDAPVKPITDVPVRKQQAITKAASGSETVKEETASDTEPTGNIAIANTAPNADTAMATTTSDAEQTSARDSNKQKVKKIIYVPQKQVIVRDTVVKKVKKEKRVKK